MHHSPRNDSDRFVETAPAELERKAKRYAVWLLARREWGRSELKSRLMSKGYPEEVCEAVITVLEENGLQSDARMAAARARARGASRGNRIVKAELKAKGISTEVADEALAELPDELHRALKALARYEGVALDTATRAKIWRHLAQRGFSGDVIRKAIARFWP